MNKYACELVSSLIFNRKKRHDYRCRHCEDLHPERKMARLIRESLAIQAWHREIFLKYKNMYQGREVAVVACGPSAADYPGLPGVAHIGVNAAYQLPVDLDFLFVQDFYKGIRDKRQEIIDYRKGQCRKFFGIIGADICGADNRTWSESDSIEAGAERYFVGEAVRGEPGLIPMDISSHPLADYQSVVFSALQFALWTNPRVLYLVGCDCSCSGHFGSKKANELDVESVLAGYDDLKAFAAKWYPATRIVSVNPVGLKGRFEDLCLSRK